MSPRPGSQQRPSSGPGRPGRTRASSAGPARTSARGAGAPARAGRPPEQPRSRMTGRAIVLLVILLALGVSYAASMKAWLNQRSETNALRTEISERTERVDALRAENRRLDDPAYIRVLATQKFGWVMPGETGYTVLGKDGTPIVDGGNDLTDPESTITRVEPAWWQSAWKSVEQADKTPEELAREARLRREPAREPADTIGNPEGQRGSDE